LPLRAAKQRANKKCCRILHSGLFISFCRCGVENKRGGIRRVKYWEIIADNLHKAGWSSGCVSALDGQGRTIWIADAHGYGKRFVVRAEEKLTAFSRIGDSRSRRIGLTGWRDFSQTPRM